MESLSQGDSSANSSDPDDELGPEYIDESGLARILGRMTGNHSSIRVREGLPTTRPESWGAATLLRAARCQALLLDPKSMTTFPRACPFSKYPRASAASLSL
jgi:hypothetical protein